MGAYEDKYCYPGTNVLRNSKNIRDPRELERVDTMVSVQVLASGEHKPINPTLRGLQDAHRGMFKELYPETAGEIRTVNMGRTAEDGRVIPFMNGDRVRPALEDLMKTVATETRRIGGRADMDQFTDRAANYLAQLNRIHPFVDGNGRVQQLFLQGVGNRFGYKVSLADVHRANWSEASIDSFRQKEGGDHFKMRLLIEDASSRMRTGQLDRGDRLAELRSRYQEAGQPSGQKPTGGQRQ